MSTDRVLRLISRTIDGVETLVNTESGEIFIDVPASTPRYIRVEEGDTVQEGDIRSRTERELESLTLRKWTIEKIGRKTVVGMDQKTGEQHEWDRKSLEKQLAIGGLSTNLTSFDRVNVSKWSRPSDNEGERSDVSLVVVVYGNDSRKFSQTFRAADDGPGDRSRVELVESDAHIETFEPILRKRFDTAVESALYTEGYTV